MKRNAGLPYSKDTEQLVLGTLLSTRGSLDEVSNMLTEDCFYFNFHRVIFKGIKKLNEKGLRYDSMAVWNEIRGKVNQETDWPEYLAIFSKTCFDLPQHVAHLYDQYSYRRLHEIGQYLLDNVHTTEDPLDIIAEAKKRLDGMYSDCDTGVITMNEATTEVMDTITKNLNNPEPVIGTPTGFKELDARGILRPSSLTVIAADSSQGKTSLATTFCYNGASKGAKIAFYTLEMEPRELAARMLSRETNINSRHLMSSPLSSSELHMVDKSVQKVCDLPIYFDGRSNSNIDVITSSIRVMKKRYGIDGAVVDYLQILSINKHSGADTEERLASMARSLKNLAKDLGIWIIALSQLNRDKQDTSPVVGRIRGSGQIAEAADNVILLYRPEYYGRDKRYPDPFNNVSTENTALIDVAKGRNIGTMKMICGFNAPTTHFYELERISYGNNSQIDDEEDKPF